jgi:hypothetical protein
VGKPRGESYGKKLNCKGFAGDVIPFASATNKDYLDAYRWHFLSIPELAQSWMARAKFVSLKAVKLMIRTHL